MDGWMGVRKEVSAESEGGLSAIAVKNTSSEIPMGGGEGRVLCDVLPFSTVRDRACLLRDGVGSEIPLTVMRSCCFSLVSGPGTLS